MTIPLFEERQDELTERRIRSEAAKAIDRVRQTYIADCDRATLIADKGQRDEITRKFAWIDRELARAASLAATGVDSGDCTKHWGNY